MGLVDLLDELHHNRHHVLGNVTPHAKLHSIGKARSTSCSSLPKRLRHLKTAERSLLTSSSGICTCCLVGVRAKSPPCCLGKDAYDDFRFRFVNGSESQHRRAPLANEGEQTRRQPPISWPRLQRTTRQGCGELVHSVITPTSATVASTLPLNLLSDCTSTKKKRRGKKITSRSRITRIG